MKASVGRSDVASTVAVPGKDGLEAVPLRECLQIGQQAAAAAVLQSMLLGKLLRNA